METVFKGLFLDKTNHINYLFLFMLTTTVIDMNRGILFKNG